MSNFKIPEKTSDSTVTRDLNQIDQSTQNLYESVVVLSKRANQLNIDLKEELQKKLEEFSSDIDNLEEIFENREQIEISRYYEQLPKPTLVAIQEFLEGKVYHRNPSKDDA
ncbi:MAG: DNA-directed RNA polymerase subunit omega [Bacteroidota bacterium]|nr:DNA-directed RNA polymerase subunit omega [Bacteroidota bacterium]